VEQEVGREAIRISLDGLVQSLGADAEEECEISIQHDALSANEEDRAVELLHRYQVA